MWVSVGPQQWAQIELEITVAKGSHAVAVKMNLSALPRFQGFKASRPHSIWQNPGDLITTSRATIWGTSFPCLNFALPGGNEVRRSEDLRLGKWKKGKD